MIDHDAVASMERKSRKATSDGARARAGGVGRRRSVRARHDRKSLLRFITCGSVDDGKSTLIGRLLYERSSCPTTSWRPSRRTRSASARATATWTSPCCSTASPPSASRASRSTSPTVLLAPRGASSSSPTRQDTSNTRATWLLVLRPPTWRSSSSMRARVCCRRPGGIATSSSLLGIRHIVLAVNKMDLVAYSEAVFRRHRGGIPRLRASRRYRARRVHAAVGAARRQHLRPARQHAMVCRTDSPGAPRGGRDR